MPAGKPSRLKWSIRAAVLALIAYGIWQLFGLHVDDPAGPVTPREARVYTSVPVPPEARNIRVAANRQWIEYGEYVRFEAPVDVCLQYAKAVVPGAPLEPADPFQIKYDARPLRDVFRDFTWFDLAAAEQVVTAGGGSGAPQVWVDQKRGVLYYRETD